MQTWENAIIKQLQPYKLSKFIIESTATFSVSMELIFNPIKRSFPVRIRVFFNYAGLLGKYDESMTKLLDNICYEIKEELHRQISYNNKKHGLNRTLGDYLRLDDSADMKVSNEIKRSEIFSAATKWVFETNGNRWSNNNSECGDNFGSFLEGVKFAVEHLGVKIIEDDSE